MRNVAYFSSAKIPSTAANSVHIMKMCNAFAQLGHKVTLFAYVDKSFTVDEVMDTYQVEHRFNIVRLKQYRIPFYATINSLFGVFYACWKLRADLIIGRDIKACYFTTLLKRNVYFETHGPIVESGRLNHHIFKRLIRSKHLIKLVLITNSLRNYYANKYPQVQNKILVIPDGADEVRENSITKIDIKKNDKLNVGYTGHLYPGKGMEIIANLVKLCPNVHFHVVGGKEEDIKRWKSALTTQKNITFHGFVNHKEVNNYISEFDIVLLPNQKVVGSNAGRDIGNWTSPLKLFEYMAMGKPIICSDIAVLREVVIHNQNAILCDPENVTEWKKAMEFLRDNPRMAKKIGEFAKLDFKKNYSWARRAKKILDDY